MSADPRQLAVGAFREKFGRSPRAVAVAPGRVNLIGEHTDYNGGHVLPMAVDRHVAVAFDAARGSRSRFWLTDFGEMAEFDGKRFRAADRGRWVNYFGGPAGVLAGRGIEVPQVEAAVAADLSRSGGLSSSAAAETAAALAFLAVAGRSADFPPQKLALLCQEAEHNYAGVNCGIMDQMAVAAAEEGKAIYLDCRNLFIRQAPMPQKLAVLVADCGVPRKLVEGEYNLRREDCESAARKLSKELGRKVQLAEVEHDELSAYGRKLLTPRELKRARHVVGEELRTARAVEYLRKGDLEAFGELARDSHRSLAEDYEVSLPQLDALVDAACEMDGVYGARLTGAGFGGSAVVFCRAEAAAGVCAELAAAYKQATGIETKPVRVKASAGARVEPVPA